MAIPRVFVSSTCVDLKYIRENIKYLIEEIGYEPILSEYDGVYFDYEIHTHDSCINEVGNCQIFILIIGGRYGGEYILSKKEKYKKESITLMEYKRAFELGIPIFTFIDSNVYNSHHIHKSNKSLKAIKYPGIDDKRVFEFIDEVKKQNKNNSIKIFHSYQEIQQSLKKQLAGMVHKLLSERRDLSVLTKAIEKQEILLKNLIGNNSGNIETSIETNKIGFKPNYIANQKYKNTNGKIVYYSYRNNSWDIYSLDLKTNKEKQLTRDTNSINGSPKWSPDGTKILFISDRLYKNEKYNIYVMNEDGTELRALTDKEYSDGRPSWSPNGKTIAFQSNRNSKFDLDYRIYLMDENGNNLSLLTKKGGAYPNWSPDGESIVYEVATTLSYQIEIIDSNGKNIRRLTDDERYDYRFPIFSPDGTKIAFCSKRYANDDYAIFIMDSDGANKTMIAENGEFPTWSRDSKFIIYSSYGKLRSVSIDNSMSRIILDNRFINLSPDYYGLYIQL